MPRAKAINPDETRDYTFQCDRDNDGAPVFVIRPMTQKERRDFAFKALDLGIEDIETPDASDAKSVDPKSLKALLELASELINKHVVSTKAWSVPKGMTLADTLEIEDILELSKAIQNESTLDDEDLGKSRAPSS